MSGFDKLHLSRQDLNQINGINGIVENLGTMLTDARFERGKKEGEEYCVDKRLPEACKPLFTALGLEEASISKVSG